MSRSEKVNVAMYEAVNAAHNLCWEIAKFEQDEDRFDGAYELFEHLARLWNQAIVFEKQMRKLRVEEEHAPYGNKADKYSGIAEAYEYVMEWLYDRYGGMGWKHYTDEAYK